MPESEFGDRLPNLFHAAIHDDIVEMEEAIARGGSLDEQDQDLDFTPIHVAAINGSASFLRAAAKLEFNPWLRDKNLRLPIDHAAARQFKEGQRILLEKMYPSKG